MVRVLLLTWVLLSSSALARGDETQIHTVALFNGRAMLAIDGGKPKILKEGETYQGVKLLTSNTKQAVIELEGEQHELVLNGAVTLSGSLGSSAPAGAGDTVQLWADNDGFFRSVGAINGRRLEFLVDTGANLVVLSSAQANRIGLDYRSGQRGIASTASGEAPMYVFEAREVTFNSITLDSITTGVIEGNHPRIPLLGMSFLERVDMNRSGNQMLLKKRY